VPRSRKGSGSALTKLSWTRDQGRTTDQGRTKYQVPRTKDGSYTETKTVFTSACAERSTTVSMRPQSSFGGTRRFVACSNAYAISMSRGSLQAVPVKLTPIGDGFASKPAGAFGAFRTMPNGTMIVG